MQLLPTFAYFTDEMRTLHDSYVVAEVAASMPASLGNLLALSGVSIGEWHGAVKENILPEIRTLEDRANKALEKTVSKAWSQSDLIVRLTCDAGNLRVLVQDTSSTYSDLSERSDGLRQFVALRAFMANSHLRHPILLIDELEQRLHYDAQADLVQVLQTQSLAPKIV
jgi:predicted ATPase